MRLLSLLLVLFTISHSYAQTYTSIILQGEACTTNTLAENTITVGSNDCKAACGAYYKATVSGSTYTLNKYTDNACTTAAPTEPTQTIACDVDNKPVAAGTDLLAQCVQATSATAEPSNTWLRYVVTGGPTNYVCSTDGVSFINSTTTCQEGCNGSFKVTQPWLQHSANYNQFSFFSTKDCSGNVVGSNSVIFACGTEGTQVTAGDFKVACYKTLVTTTGTSTITGTTTGSATTVVTNITLLLVALLFSLL